mmetsp:Transcript_53289/g.130139  ORF Transcript_53289/g.130139 Transcript_53289/m.130139 type:complete len:274 (-) Transcript_53289:182-1003(-)
MFFEASTTSRHWYVPICAGSSFSLFELQLNSSIAKNSPKPGRASIWFLYSSSFWIWPSDLSDGSITMLLWKIASRLSDVRPSMLGMVLSLLSAALSSVSLARFEIDAGRRMILLLNTLISLMLRSCPIESGSSASSFLYRYSTCSSPSPPISSGSFLILLSLAFRCVSPASRCKSEGSSARRFSRQSSDVSDVILPSPDGIDVSLFCAIISSLVLRDATSSMCPASSPVGWFLSLLYNASVRSNTASFSPTAELVPQPILGERGARAAAAAAS